MNERTLALKKLGRAAEAEACAREALDLCQEKGDRGGMASALTSLATLYMDQGRPGQALPLLREVLDLGRLTGSLAGEAGTLGNMAACHLAPDEPEEACRLARRSISLHRKVRVRAGEYHDLSVLGEALCRLGRGLQGLACCETAVEKLEALGESRSVPARERLGRVRENLRSVSLSPARREVLVREALSGKF